ncbi:MAG: hypothetical protein D6712_06955 [Chloroflexi bacterium]|nr:MAG: hypothetical protein D6712_06955 [Chloroflexota bacterium]
MRTTVIIGGGLSGLVAAYTLQNHNIPYTLIEVKRRVGGAISTVRQNGFVMDGGPSLINHEEGQQLYPFLDSLHIGDELFEAKHGLSLRSGMQILTDTLDMKLTGGRLHRMAVSSIGQIGRIFTICMENGLMFDARSLIVAVPARYAERIFYGYIPEISELLMDYRYDTIARLSLGYANEHLPTELKVSAQKYPFVYRFSGPPRAPTGYSLLHIGVRLTPPIKLEADEIIANAIKDLNLSPAPTVWHLDYWPEADPLNVYDAQHAQDMMAISELLPGGVALIGNDYAPTSLQQNGIYRIMKRIQLAQEAARGIANYLGATRN